MGGFPVVQMVTPLAAQPASEESFLTEDEWIPPGPGAKSSPTEERPRKGNGEGPCPTPTPSAAGAPAGQAPPVYSSDMHVSSSYVAVLSFLFPYNYYLLITFTVQSNQHPCRRWYLFSASPAKSTVTTSPEGHAVLAHVLLGLHTGGVTEFNQATTSPQMLWQTRW
jgi:hypothetical protein